MVRLVKPLSTFLLTDKRHNFKKYTASRINSLRSPYDYDSIMHYGRTAFGSGKVTIQTKNPKYACRVGQRDGFSQEDVFQLNSKYCPGTVIFLIQTSTFNPAFII